MLALLLAAALAAPAPDLAALASAAVELVPLPAGKARLEVDALGGRILLHVEKPGDWAQVLRKRTGTICAQVAERPGAVELRCASRRIAARIDRGRLEIRQLRGLPQAAGADGPPPPVAAEAGCSSTAILPLADCLAARGETGRARTLLEALAGTPERQAAGVRLGDLALASGGFAQALGHYRAAAGTGVWGRMASARVCELVGDCLGTPRERAVFDSAGLPAALRDELDLRGARALAFQGDLAGALRRLGASTSACGSAPTLCRRLVLEALRSDEPDVRVDALAAFAQLADVSGGPLAAELAAAAAEVAADTDAPGFGARALAATVGEAAAADLPAHLLRAAQLFLAADERARAELILLFARERLPAATLRTPAWKAIAAGVERVTPPAPEPARAPEPDPAQPVELEADLAAARAAAGRARERLAPAAARASQSETPSSPPGEATP